MREKASESSAPRKRGPPDASHDAPDGGDADASQADVPTHFACEEEQDASDELDEHSCAAYAAELFARSNGDGAEEGEDRYDSWVERDKDCDLDFWVPTMVYARLPLS